MTLLGEVNSQRVAFLRKGYDAPNRLLVPYSMRHQLLGELVDIYRLSFLNPSELTVNGMRVRYSHECKRMEVSLCLE